MKPGPDDRQRQHVAGCKPSRNKPPSGITQLCYTTLQSHQILVVSLDHHHVTLGLPLPRGIRGQVAFLIFTIIYLNTTGIVPITMHCTGSWIVLLFSTCLIQSNQTRYLFQSILFTNPRSGPCWAISRKTTRTPRFVSPTVHYPNVYSSSILLYQRNHYSCETRVVAIILPL